MTMRDLKSAGPLTLLICGVSSTHELTSSTYSWNKIECFLEHNCSSAFSKVCLEIGWTKCMSSP